MLSMAAYPPVQEDVAAWFSRHENERTSGTAYRFAVDYNGKMIGLVDLNGVNDQEATLGYWYERSAWGQGFAFEAAHALVQFAIGEIALTRLRAGHAADNPASGRVLIKLEFQLLDVVTRPSKSRETKIEQWRYLLDCSYGA
jgi:RimJ/RimL family protein N-acetyltransferase